MPCYKCDNGKYKFGQTGSCQYDTLAECESANKDYYNQETYNDYPKAASANAARALKWLEENDNPNDCLTPVGFARANQLKNRENLSRDVIARMAQFKRHQQNKDVPYEEGCGGIAWDCWGGDEGIAWAIRKMEQIEREKNMNNKEHTEISERIKKALQNKMEKHNEDVKDLKKDWNPKVTMAKLTACFKRGVGAYYTNPESVREGVTGPDQWALARCNSFLYALKNGRYRSGKHDTDLLPEGHPMRNTKKEKQSNMDKDKKYYSDDQHDMHIHLTEEMMSKLHKDGMLEMMMEDDMGKESMIKITYEVKDMTREDENSYHEDEEKSELTQSMLDDELDVYIDKLTESIKKLNGRR